MRPTDVTCSDQTFVKLTRENMEVLNDENLLEPLISAKKYRCKYARLTPSQRQFSV